ncbi:ROK family protein [Bacillus sp. IITD106]|nr:ROK family protein [Bacillus sp. IITD106]
MNKYVIAFDVGGSFIKSTILNEHGEIITDSFAIFPSKSKESKEAIIENLFLRIKQQINRILDKEINVVGVGFAFPGPFAYEEGISYIRDVDKFDQLYEVNLRKELMELVKQEKSFKGKIDDNFRILFDNDANLFALGEQMTGKGKNYNKAIYLTIGTGAGSAFMEDGNLVKHDSRVPENGWIFKQPFGDSIVDDYISKRGILRLTEEFGIDIEDKEVKTIAEMAKSNHTCAKKVFHIFGQNIGKALNSHIKAFSPEALIIGGQIAKSKDLFIGGIYEVLDNKTLMIEFTEDTSLSTFTGVANLIKQTISISP